MTARGGAKNLPQQQHYNICYILSDDTGQSTVIVHFARDVAAEHLCMINRARSRATLKKPSCGFRRVINVKESCAGEFQRIRYAGGIRAAPIRIQSRTFPRKLLIAAGKSSLLMGTRISAAKRVEGKVAGLIERSD